MPTNVDPLTHEFIEKANNTMSKSLYCINRTFTQIPVGAVS